ncbi:Alpha/Beta hydrolase protein [Mrakia frigida]|uniref:Alpha/Beta hydrolase protein n=1 Tax=Mrakia frigida TaxID=29902 RepID=UPI003FCC26BB
MSSTRSASVSLFTPGIQSKLFTPPNPRTKTLAVIAHPWSRLGGNWNDPVVQTLLQTFLRLSVPTAIFNSRGAGETSLRSSWNGKGEINDFGLVANEARRVAWEGAQKSSEDEKGEVYFCGYSYGSMLALGQQPLEGPLTFFLAISPVPTFNFYLFPFVTHSVPPSPLPSPRNRLLVLHGERDNFCSSSSARTWLDKLGTGYDFYEIEEEDHFWRGKEGLKSLDGEVSRWVELGRENEEDDAS